MKKIKKITSLLIAGTMLMSMAGCQSNSDKDSDSGAKSDSEQVTINLWHEWTVETDGNRIALDKAVADYQAAHSNVKIETHMLENEAYKQKISTEFAGKAKGIDVFFYWGGGRGGTLANADKLLCIEDYLSDEIKSTIKLGAAEQFTYNGKQYALPTFSWMMVLYCNDQMFEKAGAKLPETYDELKEAVELLKTSGVDIPLAQGIKDGWQAAFVYEALAMRNVGVDNILKMFKGEAGMDDAGYLKAAEMTNELYKIGTFGKNPLEINNDEADSMFLTGKSAMRLQGNWYTDALYTNKDSIFKDGNTENTVTAMPVPLTEGCNPSDYSGGFVDTFFVNKNTENPETAVDFCVSLCQTVASARQESGQGFSGFILPANDGNLPAVGKQIVDIANNTVAGAIAWDTALDAATAQIHLDAVQELFTDSGNPEAVIAKHKEVIK